MATKVLGPTGSSRRRRFLAVPLTLAALLALFWIAGAQAVHDTGVFQLDGNAQTSVQSSPPALEDWDLICKAHAAPITPTTCTFAAGVTPPAGTTTSTASAHVADGVGASIFTGGGSKDPQDIPNWKHKNGSVPDKDNLLHSFAARYTIAPSAECPVASGLTECELLYFGSDRFDNSGDATQGFWFFQNQVTLNANGTFNGVHADGDLLVVSDFSNGGDVATINIFKWEAGGLVFVDGGDAAKCDSALASPDAFCGIVNPVNPAPGSGGLTTSPWTFLDKSGNSNFLNGEFFEAGLNLSHPDINLAGECFSSVLSETRSSTSTTAVLKDFVLGQFDVCEPELTTQASTNGSVTPGTEVHDTATVTVTGAANPDDATGTVDFFLCADNTEPFNPPDCSTDGTLVGDDIPLTDTSSPPNTEDGISGADSPDVNTDASPLAPGAYCFAAVADLTNYADPSRATNTTTECFTVAKIPTTTVTEPRLAADGTPITAPVPIGTHVVDHALVTGTDAGGNPTGTVDFFICNPTQVTGGAGSEVCADPNGTALAGNPVTLTPVAGSSSQSEATSSPDVIVNMVGVWCFRAVYTPTGSTYLGSSDATHTECFTVRDSTSITSVQNWLPNDSATVTSTGGIALNGTLSFTLRTGTCTGAVVYTEPDITLTNAASGSMFNTTNTTFKVTAANNATPYFWRVVFTPSSPLVDGFTKCERTDITINDNP
jgi:hypothetical protein